MRVVPMDQLTSAEGGPGPVVWTHEVKVDDAVTFRAGRRGTRLIAEWPGLATLACARDGSSARFTPNPGASQRSVAKLQRGHAMALLHDLRGGLALHASAIAIDGHAVVFVGSSGTGKSTAAAEMCLHHGAQLLADDVAILEVHDHDSEVMPSEKDHWLTAASCAALGLSSGPRPATDAKCDLPAQRVAAQRYPLALVIALSFQPSVQGVALRRLHGAEAALLLLRAAFRFDVEDGAARSRELHQVTAVHGRVPVLELARNEGEPDNIATPLLRALR